MEPETLYFQQVPPGDTDAEADAAGSKNDTLRKTDLKPDEVSCRHGDRSHWVELFTRNSHAKSLPHKQSQLGKQKGKDGHNPDSFMDSASQSLQGQKTLSHVNKYFVYNL